MVSKVYSPKVRNFVTFNHNQFISKGFGGVPFITIQQKHEGLYLRTNSNPDPDYDPENDNNLIKSQYTITRNVALGKWHDLVFHIIWDFKTEGAGLLQVDYKIEDWEKYLRVVDVQEPNMYNREGYNKWGIYKPGWKEHPELTNVTMRKIWHDNIRIGFSRDSVDPDQFR